MQKRRMPGIRVDNTEVMILARSKQSVERFQGGANPSRNDKAENQLRMKKKSDCNSLFFLGFIMSTVAPTQC